MAGASDSDDGSELFWPGYVDAVTNLAINLLFVIAIMAIVVMTANLQISQLVPKKGGGSDESNIPPSAGRNTEKKLKYQDTLETIIKAQTVYKKMLDQAEVNPNIALRQAPTTVELNLILQDLEGKLQKTMESQLKEDFTALKVEFELKNSIQKLELQIALAKKQEEKLKKELDEIKKKDDLNNRDSDGFDKLKIGQNNDSNSEYINKPLQEVRADNLINKAANGQSKLQDLKAGGIVVVFGNDVIDLSENEVSELIKKITTSGPIKGARWQLRVISPKGFSEATRIAYYRVNSLRNVLLKNGAISSDIEMRVVEAEGGQANNARVLVRQMP